MEKQDKTREKQGKTGEKNRKTGKQEKTGKNWKKLEKWKKWGKKTGDLGKTGEKRQQNAHLAAQNLTLVGKNLGKPQEKLGSGTVLPIFPSVCFFSGSFPCFWAHFSLFLGSFFVFFALFLCLQLKLLLFWPILGGRQFLWESPKLS